MKRTSLELGIQYLKELEQIESVLYTDNKINEGYAPYVLLEINVKGKDESHNLYTFENCKVVVDALKKRKEELLKLIEEL